MRPDPLVLALVLAFLLGGVFGWLACYGLLVLR